MKKLLIFLSNDNIGDSTIYETKLGFLSNIGGIKKSCLKKVYNSIVKLKDENKLVLASALLDRWFIYQTNTGNAYIKHVASGRANLLHQVVLSGKAWDGVYEFRLAKKQINTRLSGDKLIIEAPDNFNSASFYNKKREEYAIHRSEFRNEQEFLDKLIEMGFVDREEVEIYNNPEPWLQEYMACKLPKLSFEDGGEEFVSNQSQKNSQIAV